VLSSVATVTRTAWLHPATLRAAVGAFVIGTIGGALPTGVLASSTGAGIGRGVSWGLWAYAACSPALLVFAAVTICAARYEHRTDQDLFLAGQPHRATLWKEAVAAVSVAIGMTVPVVIGAATSGIADALAQTTTLWTPVAPGALWAALGASCWMALLSVLVVGAVRNATLAYGILLGWLLAGIAATYVTASQAAWDVLSASPVGSFAFVTRSVVAGRAGVVTHVWLILGMSLIWVAVLTLTIVRRHRRLVPRSPAG
jgi:hypothetical protein